MKGILKSVLQTLRLLDFARKARVNILRKVSRSERLTQLRFYRGSLMNLTVNNNVEGRIFTQQTLEPELTMLFESIVKEGHHVLDVGANCGVHALNFSKLVGKHGKVWAIDPVHYNVRKLRLNGALNGARNLSIKHCALGATKGKMLMNIAKEDSFFTGNSSLALNEKMEKLQQLNSLENVEVDVDTLDSFVEENSIKKLDFVKIDVEGFEIEVLKGARSVLELLKPVVVMEYSQKRLRHLNIDECAFSQLLTSRYDCYEIMGNTDREAEFALSPYKFNREMSFGNLLCVPKDLYMISSLNLADGSEEIEGKEIRDQVVGVY